jgi:hypothetical protein
MLHGGLVLVAGFFSAPLLTDLKAQRKKQPQQQQKADHGNRNQAGGHVESVIHFLGV